MRARITVIDKYLGRPSQITTLPLFYFGYLLSLASIQEIITNLHPLV